MRKFGSIVMLLMMALLLCIVTGCSNDDTKTGDSKNKTPGATIESPADSKDTGDNGGAQTGSNAQAAATTDTGSGDSGKQDSGDSKSNDGEQTMTFTQNYTDEEKKIMGDLTGSWESQTPNDNGTTKVVRAKIDNVSGFTLTTGDMNPDGQGTFYSRVGSYEVDGNNIIFSATTGGESNDGSSYRLRQDPGVFQYTFEENPEMTQLTLTPTNDAAKQLTGEAPVVLTK